uniref:L-ascorbate oxidase homolog n=1 Tax=Nicotiana tabacum TaxID=4097 RepID=A0A1S4CQE0_TOBAC|nr:PREDICTED: L-ascorbate oxidase homolog [Nicotiana tabacum]
MFAAPQDSHTKALIFTIFALCLHHYSYLCSVTLQSVYCDNPYRYYTWKITYGDIYPLGVKQQGILINGQFPGPQIVTTQN